MSTRWRVRPCPCGYRECTSALIEPGIVGFQGAISRQDAERAVRAVNEFDLLFELLQKVVSDLEGDYGTVLRETREEIEIFLARQEEERT